MRGGREMDNHFEVMWDLFRSIPYVFYLANPNPIFTKLILQKPQEGNGKN